MVTPLVSVLSEKTQVRVTIHALKGLNMGGIGGYRINTFQRVQHKNSREMC